MRNAITWYRLFVVLELVLDNKSDKNIFRIVIQSTIHYLENPVYPFQIAVIEFIIIIIAA